jgi:electron transfer flavoprotein alpha subunit
MGGTIVLVELDADGVAPPSAAALAASRSIAARMSEPLEAVVVGPVDGQIEGDLGTRLGRSGVSRVHLVTHALLGDYSPECWGEALTQLVNEVRPSAVIAPATARGNEAMAQAAARADLPLATNCVSLEPDVPAWRLSRTRQGGMLLEDAELSADVVLATIVSGGLPPADDAGRLDGGAADAATLDAAAPAAPARVVIFTPEFGPEFVHSRLVDRTAEDTGVSLATARVVVSGGRGVGGAEGFLPLEELAKLTGGAVGCSRVATNNGWRPHRDQVGQTGTKISPELYIACGISGATQHWVGCMGAAHILAVNTDPEAPLVTRASHAVIGDVAEVILAVVDEIHRRARRE